MADKAKGREMYVDGVHGAGPGRVRVVLRDGDPPKEGGNGPHTAAAPGDIASEVPLIMPIDEAPATYSKVLLKLESR